NNVDIVTSAFAKGIKKTDKGEKVTYEANRKEETIEDDYVLDTVGRKPNTQEIRFDQICDEADDKSLIKINKQYRTNVKNIYVIGDIVDSLALAHKASYEGKGAAEAISGKKTEIDYIGMPAVVFSDPEMASVVYTEQQAKDEKIDVKVWKLPFAANGRELSFNETE